MPQNGLSTLHYHRLLGDPRSLGHVGEADTLPVHQQDGRGVPGAQVPMYLANLPTIRPRLSGSLPDLAANPTAITLKM